VLEVERGVHAVVQNAYAPFDFPTTQQFINGLSLMGVKLEHVLATPQKNSADLLLAIDCMELLYRRDDIGHFVIVGGDRDYIPVAQRIMKNAKEVLVVSPRHSMSGDLLAIVGEDRYLDTADLLPRDKGGAKVEETGSPSPVEPLTDSNDTEKIVPPTADRTAAPKAKPRPTSSASRAPRIVRPSTIDDLMLMLGDDQEFENQKKLMRRILEFQKRMRVKEIYLSPFFREMNDAFPYMSNSQRKGLLNRLMTHGAVNIEDRNREQAEGTYAVLVIDDWSHPLVMECNPGDE